MTGESAKSAVKVTMGSDFAFKLKMPMGSKIPMGSDLNESAGHPNI